MSEREGHNRIRIEIQPSGRRVEVAANSLLLDAARAAGVDLLSVCGGAGFCETCRVRIMNGDVSPPTALEAERLGPERCGQGWRLACQARVYGPAVIDVPRESIGAGQRLQIEAATIDVTPDPVVRVVDVRMTPPSIADPRGDVPRLVAALAEVGARGVQVPLWQVRALPGVLRHHGWTCRAVLRGGHLAGVLPPSGGVALGLAADLGTTKVAAYLVDLERGTTLASAGRMNPQVAWGEDVISRIARASRSAEDLRDLHAALIGVLNELAAELCAERGVPREWIVEAVLVGNTAMHHLAAGLPVQQLGEAPYVPVVAGPLELPAAAVDLDLSPGAVAYFPPNIAGYVGADHVAALAAARADETEATLLVVDIGTNTEITVVHQGRLVSCSCASGPAFEGAHIAEGMRAAPGAIERVFVHGGEVNTRTVGGLPPAGICGSGILDAVAELVRAGALDRHGRFRVHPLVRAEGRAAEFLLVPASRAAHGRDIVLTRADVSEIQLAKAAIRAGIDVLLAEAGVAPEAIDRVIVAGAFGTYLDVGAALRIGLFPPVVLERVEQVGNAAGAGARDILVSARRRREAERIAGRVEYVELTGHPAFTDRFAAALAFDV